MVRALRVTQWWMVWHWLSMLHGKWKAIMIAEERASSAGVGLYSARPAWNLIFMFYFSPLCTVGAWHDLSPWQTTSVWGILPNVESYGLQHHHRVISEEGGYENEMLI